MTLRNITMLRNGISIVVFLSAWDNRVISIP